jgi:DNA-directed RNA polymerase specialized sigma24 family protein
MSPAKRPPDHANSFHTTRWTQVRSAKADSDDGRKALADLCDAYYEPVVAFLRAELGDADAAREMSHEFFAQLLAGGGITHAEREHGRFRSYLLGAVKHFLAHQREAAQRLKRGGGAVPVSLDEDASAVRAIPDAAQISPDVAFDRQWAITTLVRALDAVRAECTSQGRADFFEKVKPWLTGDAAHGDQAARSRLRHDTRALKMAIQRLEAALPRLREGGDRRYAGGRRPGGRRRCRFCSPRSLLLKKLRYQCPPPRQAYVMSDSPALPKSCPQCGAALPAEATDGLCPKCLMGEAMQPTIVSDASKPKNSAILAPEDLAPFFPSMRSCACSAAAAWARCIWRSRSR